ncbi:MAG: hypothetical protein ACLFR1_05785 [Spirochaetia bacterium]
MIELNEILLLSIRFGITAVATFLAIILWSKTRDPAWMFIVIAVIVNYGEIVFQALDMFGIVRAGAYVLWNVEVLRIVLSNLPTVFLIIAFCIMIFRKRKY